MVRPRDAQIDGLMDTILDMDHDRVPIEQIRSTLKIHASLATLKRRLRAWRASEQYRRLHLSSAQQEAVKERIPHIVYSRFCNDKQLLKALQEEGYMIGSLWKMRQLRKAAGVSRNRTANDAAYDLFLAAKAKEALDGDDINLTAPEALDT